MGADDAILGMTKKVVEIKRGDPVPRNAKWLKDKNIQVIDKIEYSHYPMGMDMIKHVHEEIYDVFEVDENE